MSLSPLQRDAWSSTFFDAAASGQLVVLRCDACGGWSAPQARRCATCSSDRVKWVAVSGRGVLVTWTTPHRRSGDATEPAHVVAIVELEEGPWIHASGSVTQVLVAGQPVSIGFSAVEGGESLPVLLVDDFDDTTADRPEATT